MMKQQIILCLSVQMQKDKNVIITHEKIVKI